MKLFKSLMVCMLFFGGMQGQNISGQAFYESKTTLDMNEFGGGQMDEATKKMIGNRMKSMLEKTYILTFSGDESIYKEEEKLEAGPGGQGGGFRAMMGSFTPGKQYKNLKTNEMIQEQEFFSKKFLIKDSIPALKWEMSKESKQIGQYIAFKATAMKKVNADDFSMMRRRGRGRGGNKAEEVKTDSIKKDPIDEIEIPKEVMVTAWYTPMIPIKNGPAEYAGLPGLILELNAHRTTVLCSKIILNPKEGEEITVPTKGKVVTKEEYTKIVTEKTKEMRENFRQGGGRRGGHFGG